MQSIKITLEVEGTLKEFWVAAVGESELKEVSTIITELIKELIKEY